MNGYLIIKGHFLHLDIYFKGHLGIEYNVLKYIIYDKRGWVFSTLDSDCGITSSCLCFQHPGQGIYMFLMMLLIGGLSLVVTLFAPVTISL